MIDLEKIAKRLTQYLSAAIVNEVRKCSPVSVWCERSMSHGRLLQFFGHALNPGDVAVEVKHIAAVTLVEAVANPSYSDGAFDNDGQ